MTRNLLAVIGLIGLVLCLPAPAAHAYLDPGTGSFLVQMLVGGVAAGAAGVAMYWNRLKALVFGSGTVQAEKDAGADREIQDDNG